MNFMKRAGLYCCRQRCRTIILFLVLTLIAALMLTGIAIRDASAGAAEDVQTAIGGKIMLELDTEGHMGIGQQNQWGTAYTYNGDFITQDMIAAIERVEGVVGYNSEDTKGYWGAGVNFEYLPAALNLSYTPYGESSGYTATIASERCSDFESGKYRLVNGRHITPDDRYACLISKELADYNKLSVGDHVQMYSLDSDAITEFEIVGIFDGTEGTSGNALTVDEIPANQGYIDYATMFELFGDEINGYQQLTVYVEDPVGVQRVYDRISALPQLKGKTLKLSIDTEEYEVVSRPLESLQKLVNTAILMISIVSVFILTLLLTIRIRGRKREIGILLSVGKSKADIVLQLFAETLAVAAIAFAAAIPLSSLTAAGAGEFLASRATAGAARLYVRIDAAYVLPLYLTGMLLVAVSVIASSRTVVRAKPKDILAK